MLGLARPLTRCIHARPPPSLVRFRSRPAQLSQARYFGQLGRPLGRPLRSRPLLLSVACPAVLQRSRRAMSSEAPQPQQPQPQQRTRHPTPEEMMAARRRVYSGRNRAMLMYTTAAIFACVGLSYAAVPLYRAFCAATGFAGTPKTSTGKFAPDRLVPATEAEHARRIKVNFNADTSDALPWGFFPQQKFVYVVPGQTALAFYTARNKGTQDIIGIATYSVAPAKAAQYFAKVECFCFEEQQLLAGEEVDLPLFFFIDKDFLEDPLMRDVDDIVLSYTFFKARRNQRGHLEPDAKDEVVQASLGFSDYEHAKKMTTIVPKADATKPK